MKLFFKVQRPIQTSEKAEKTIRQRDEVCKIVPKYCQWKINTHLPLKKKKEREEKERNFMGHCVRLLIYSILESQLN